MTFLAKLYPFCRSHYKLVYGVLIILSFTAIGFTYNSQGKKWFWTSYPFIAMLLIILSITITIVLLEAQKSASGKYEDQLAHYNSNIHSLSKRQKQVFILIVGGKSNKDIGNELFIEQSTLKTHINHIYRILEINNRKDAVRIGTTLMEHLS